MMKSFDVTHYGNFAAWFAVILSCINLLWAIWKEYTEHKPGLRVYAFITQDVDKVLLKYYLYAENESPIMVRNISLISVSRWMPKRIVSKFALYKQIGSISVELLDIVDSGSKIIDYINVTNSKSNILDKIINNSDLTKLSIMARTADDKIYFGNIEYSDVLKWQSLSKALNSEHTK